MATPVSLESLVSLCKRRGFVLPSSEIYGGLANAWDYGPLGAELKNNIKQRWWQRFVHRRPDIVGLDAALLMNPKVWEASGHMEEFQDPLVECRKCHVRVREDQKNNSTSLGNRAIVIGDKPVCPADGGEHDWTAPKQFNLMLKTFLGSSEDAAATVYFRPETAQAMFMDFKQILTTTRQRLPFGIAQIGKAFRNEITPGQFIFRTREFEIMEIEYFVRANEWEKYFEVWFKEMKSWVRDLGIKDGEVHYVEIPEGERAHYSQRTIDIEYDFPFGQKELYGLAYRGDYDLQRHQQASGQDLAYADPENPQDKFLPHVIEPTWGVERSVLAVLCSAYHEEQAPTAEAGETDTRVVLKFPYWLAPVKVAVLPLSKKDELAALARPLYAELAARFACEYDDTQSIGKRYRRQDEIGTPFCVTVDFDSPNDRAVTIRERDSMEQERVPIVEVGDRIAKALEA